MDEMMERQEGERAHTEQIRLQGRRAYVIFAWALLLLLLAQVAFPLSLGTVLTWLAPWTALDLNISLLLTYGSMYLIGFPMVWLMLCAIPDRMPGRPVEADERPGPGRILGLYAMLYALSGLILLVAGFCMELLGYEESMPFEGLMEGGASPWLLFFLGVVVAPVMEELIFRWLPYRKLSGYGMRYYVVWTSLAFGLFHLNFLQGLYAGVMGFVFAIVTYRTGSVKYSIALHFLLNLTSSLGLGGLLANSGELGAMLYGALNLFLYAVGVAVLVYYLRKRFFLLRDPYEIAGIGSWRGAFLSGGYIVFVLLSVALIVLLG